jgi:hypothetical protein
MIGRRFRRAYALRNLMPPKVTLLTFYTEGPPLDHGLPLAHVNRVFEDFVAPHVDEYLAFTPRQLASLGPEAAASCADHTQWLAEHPRRHELGRYNQGWARVGFQRWKSLIIRHVLERDDLQPGDLVLYHDVNWMRYPQYLVGIPEWRRLCSAILDALGCDVFAPAGLHMYRDVKASLIRRYLPDADKFQWGVWTGLVVLRKSPQSLAFAREWAEMCADLDNSSPLPDPAPHRHIIHHSVDQSVLGVLAQRWKREGRLPKDWPRFGEGNRVFDAGMLERIVKPPTAAQIAKQRLLWVLPPSLRDKLTRVRAALRE